MPGPGKTAKYSTKELIKGSGAGDIPDPVRWIVGSYFVVPAPGAPGAGDLKLANDTAGIFSNYVVTNIADDSKEIVISLPLGWGVPGIPASDSGSSGGIGEGFTLQATPQILAATLSIPGVQQAAPPGQVIPGVQQAAPPGQVIPPITQQEAPPGQVIPPITQQEAPPGQVFGTGGFVVGGAGTAAILDTTTGTGGGLIVGGSAAAILSAGPGGGGTAAIFSAADVWLNTFSNGLYYLDDYYKRAIPFDRDELERINAIGSVAAVNVDSFYNFYAKTYENVIANPEVPESILPNFYALFTEKNYGSAPGWVGSARSLAEINTIGDNFPIKLYDEDDVLIPPYNRMGLLSAISSQSNARSRYLEYFTRYANSITSMIQETNTGEDNAIKNLYQNNYRTFIFDSRGIELLRQDITSGQMFPMHNKVSFSTDTNATFADFLIEEGTETELLKLAATQELAPPPAAAPPSLTSGQSTEEWTPDGLGTTEVSRIFSLFERTPILFSNSSVLGTNIFSDLNVAITEIYSWADSFTADALSLTSRGDFVFIGSQPVSYPFTDLNGNGVIDPGEPIPGLELFGTAAKGLIQDLELQKGRTVEEMLNGTAAYSEAIFYKIEKFAYPNAESTNSDSKPMARYYIPNSSNMDICNFVDTQVKYGKKYKYVVTSYDLVISSKIKYEVPTFEEPNTAIVEVKPQHFQNEAVMRKNVIATLDKVVVMDNPPMPPEVTIVPYKDAGEKILINFNASVGDRDLLPVVIDSSEEMNIQMLKDSQRRVDEKLRFKSDDTPGSFWVYRTTEKPKKYQDFAGHKMMEISTGDISPSAAINSIIEPNINYYYTFRTKDVHGNLSNPSIIYDIKMNDTDDGPHFLDISILDLEDVDPLEEMKDVMKAMRRYVQILPTVPQGLLNARESGISGITNLDSVTGVTNVTLGVADESLWDKKFKIRFTSKKTGRKVDLDIKFVTEHRVKQS